MSMPLFGPNSSPSDVCLRKFVIFEETEDVNEIVVHPDLSSSRDNACEKDEKQGKSLMKEDSADIDALLSTEYEEIVGSEDDFLSTARTGASATDESSSADSYSDYGTKRSCNGDCSESRLGVQIKQRRLENMMKKLKGIVPGAKQMMNTADVLDEAVHYLKFLRSEVTKIEAENSKA